MRRAVPLSSGLVVDPLMALFPGPHAHAGAEAGVLAPTTLPPTAELVDAARRVPLLEALAGAASAPVDAALVASLRGCAVADDDELLRLADVVDAYVRMRPVAWRAGCAGDERPPRWVRGADRRLPVMLLALYELAPDEAITLAALADVMATTDDEGGDEPPAERLDAAVAAVAGDLVAAGILTRKGDARVALTVLGRWYVRETLRRAGFVAPLAGELAAADAEDILAAAAQWEPGVAERELAAWVAVRGAAQAIAEVADALRADPEPALLAAAPLAFAAAGPDAAPAVRALVGDPALRPAVRAWEAAAGEPVGTATTADVAAVVAMRAWSALHRGGTAAMRNALDELVGAAGLPRVVAGLWEAPPQLAEPVLGALALTANGEVLVAARLAARRLRGRRPAA